MRIALTGHPYSGKSALANRLWAAHEWDVIDYTGQLKKEAAAAFAAALSDSGYHHVVPLTAQDINNDKERWRPFLLALGTLLGYEDGYNVEEMVEQWEQRQQRRVGARSVVFDNVRFEAQADILRRAGFIIVGLLASTSTRFKRGLDLEVDRDRRGIFPVTPDIILDAERPTAELAAILNVMAGTEMNTKADEGELNETVGSDA